MSNVATYAARAMLDYVNRGSTNNKPAAWLCALSTGSPGNAAFVGEPGTASGYSRQSCTWGDSTGASAFNVNAMTFGPFSSNCNISGIAIMDSAMATNAGNELWYGLLATARAITSGDSLIIAGSALTSQVT